MKKSTAVLVAEFFGAFVLTSAVLAGANPFVTLAILVLLIGGISGAHVNPAVSAGAASMNKLKYEVMVKFWVVQVAGALLARVVREYLSGASVSLKMDFVALDGKLLIAEIIGTAVFLMGITLAMAHKLDGLKLAVAVGGSLMIGAFFGGMLNPAVAFGFQMVSLNTIVGALIGAVLGVQLGTMLSSAKK